MKIKIQTYPKKKFTDIFFAGMDTDSKVVKGEDGNISSSQMLFIDLENGDAVKHVEISVEDKIYAAPFPNPVHLFLSQAIEHFETSIKIATEHFPQHVAHDIGGILNMPKNLDETNSAFNSYIQHRAGCTIMLVSAIESFINHTTPNSFKFFKDGRKMKKKDIQHRLPFKEKLTELIPQVKQDMHFWNNHELERDNILELYKHRRGIIHLKTNTDPKFQQYLNSIEQMLEFDLESAIKSTKIFMNLVQPNFIENEE